MIKWWHIVICGCILLAGVWTGLMIAPSVMTVQIITVDTTLKYNGDLQPLTFIEGYRLSWLLADTFKIGQPFPSKTLPQYLIIPSFPDQLIDWWFAVTRPPCQ